MFSTAEGVASDAHFPVAVLPSSSKLPDLMTIETRRNAGSQTLKDLEAIEISDMTVEVDGLIKATLDNRILSKDPTNGDPFDNLNDGTVFYIVTNVPSGAKRLVAEITASDAPDIDLFVGTGDTPSAGTLVCYSATGSWKEYCNVNDPTSGDWWILVQNWTASATSPDAVTLAYAVVEDGDNGNMSVAGPSSVSAGDSFDLSVIWNEPTMVAEDRWYGRFSVGTDASNSGNIGSVNVNLIRHDDDVVKTVDPATAFPGDALTYQIVVQPNVTSEDLLYTLTDTLPDGLTYVAGSATATAGDVDVTGNILTWSGVMPTLFGIESGYVMTTSDNDPLCDTGFGDGGYANLEDIGISSHPSISGDTVAYTTFTSGDPISYFGHDYTGMSFTDDGFAIFDVVNNYGGNPFIPQSIPDSDFPNNVLAAFWHDFEIFYDEGLNHGVSLATVGYPGGAIIVEYDDIQLWGGSSSIMDFEIVVWRDVDNTPGYYEIIYAFDNINYIPSPATIGVENASGTDGVALVSNGDAFSAIHDGFMVCFDYQSVDPIVIEYKATVDLGVSGILTNNVAHNTDNPSSEETHAIVEVEVEGGIPCDLDGDGDVDKDDRNIFKSALRTCTGDAGFLPQADYDGDGCISIRDYREWYKCWKTYR